MRNRFRLWSALFVASAFIISAGIAYGASYEELVKIYLQKESVEKQIESERVYVVSGENINADELWEEIAFEKDPSIVSEKGTRLLNYLVDGNVSEWNQLKGFLGPEGYSRSLVAFNTAIYSISALLELGDPVSSRKAYDIAKDIFNSRQTIEIIYRTSGREAFKEKGKLRELGGSKWIDNKGYELWNVNEKDSRPFGIEPVRKIRGYVNVSEAVSRKMVFLDSKGQVNSGSGLYAWDWKTGKVYRLRDREYSDEGRPDRGNRSGENPGDDDNGVPGDDDDDDDDNGQPGDDDDDDDDNGQPGDDDDDDDDNGQPGNDDDDDDNGGPGNGNGNNGNPGNGGGNNNGSGPGSGNGGSNNGQGGDSGNGGGNGNSGNNGGGGSNSGLGDGTNPGNGSDNNNAADSPGGNGTNNPGGN